MRTFKTLRKRGLALFLVLSMCLSMLPVTVLAAETDVAPHTHNEDGWKCEKVLGDLICDLEEHEHSPECYSPGERVLSCTLDETEGHTHTDECYGEETTLNCGQEESEEHIHTDDCYTTERVLTCGQEESEGHTHGEACYTEEPELTCGKEEHKHTDECYSITWNCTPPVKSEEEETPDDNQSEEIKTPDDNNNSEETQKPEPPAGAEQLDAAAFYRYAGKIHGGNVSMTELFGLYATLNSNRYPASLIFIGENVYETVVLDDADLSNATVTVRQADFLYNGSPVEVYCSSRTNAKPNWGDQGGTLDVKPGNTVVVTLKFMDGTKEVSAQKLQNGEAVQIPHMPAKDHKVFEEWTGLTQYVRDGKLVIPAETANEAVFTVNAKYTNVWYVTFHDGTRVVDVADVVQGSKLSADQVRTANGKLQLPAGESLKGWSKTNDNQGVIDNLTTMPITDDVTLYPVSEQGVWVTFDSQGGSYVEPRQVENGQVTAPDDPTRDGFTFAGWYTAAEGGTEVTLPGTVSVDTLYAHWTGKPVNFTVIYWQENPDFGNKYAKVQDTEHYSFMASATVTGHYAGEKVGTTNFSEPLPQTVRNTIAKGFDQTAHVGTLNDAQEVVEATVELAGDGSSIVNVYFNRQVYNVYFYENKSSDTCILEEHKHSYTNSKTVGSGIFSHTEYIGGCYGNSWSRWASCGKQEHTHSTGWFSSCQYEGYAVSENLTITAKYGADIASGWPGGMWSTQSSGGQPYQANIATMEETKSFYAVSQGTVSVNYWVEVAPGETGGTLNTKNNKYYKVHHTDSGVESGYTISKEDQYPIPGFVFNQDISSSIGDSYNSSARFYYDRESYHIHFFVNGEEVKDQMLTLKYEESIDGKVTFVPTAEGKTFDMWCLDETGTKSAAEVLSGKMPAKDITVYAKWQSNDKNVNVYASIHNSENNKTLVLPVGSVRTSDQLLKELGLERTTDFLGWYMKTGDSYAAIHDPYYVADDVTLYALWKSDTFSVSYTGITGAPSDDAKYALNAQAPVKAPTATTMPNDETFDHWECGGVSYKPGETIEVTGDMTLTAVGKKVEDYATDVTFHNGAESFTYSSKNGGKPIANNSSIVLPGKDAFTKTGHTLIGWSKTNGGKVDFELGATVVVDRIGSNDLYAVWQVGSYDYTVQYVTVENGTEKSIKTATTGKADFGTTITVGAEDSSATVKYPATITGYKFDHVDGSPLTINETGNVVKVYYVVDEGQQKDLSYTVEFYRNDVKYGNTDTVTKKVQELETQLSVNAIDTSAPKGYKLEKITVGGTEVDSIPAKVDGGTAIKVYFVTDPEQQKDLSYTVEYYQDDKKVDSNTETVSVQVLQPDTMKVDMSKINTTDKYEGYVLDKVRTGKIPDSVNSGDVIKVYYTKDELSDPNKDEDKNPDNGDGIPDKYQATVTLKIDGGKWNADSYDKWTKVGNTWTRTFTVTELAADGTETTLTPAIGTLPTGTPDATHTGDGNWSLAGLNDKTVVTEDVTYTLTFDKESKVTYPEAKEEGEGEDKKPVPPEEKTDNQIAKGTVIIVDPDGGKWTKPNGWTEEGNTFTYTTDVGENITLAPDPTKEGYAFVGWTKEEKVVDGVTTITYTAKWLEDKVDEKDPTKEGSDGIPDVWQATVTLNIVGGAWTATDGWTSNSNGTLTQVYNLYEKDKDNAGKWSKVDNVTVGTLPTGAAVPGFTGEGSWSDDLTVDTAVTGDASYTLTFAPAGSRAITVNYVDAQGNVISSDTVYGTNGLPYTLTTAPATLDVDGNHYVLNDTLPKTVAAGESSVNVRYAVDNNGGGNDGREPDGIPDERQAIIYYSSSNGAYGTVSGAFQAFDLGSANASGNVRLSNTASTTELSRTYFSSWTQGGTVLSTGTDLDVEFAVTAGSTYQVMANFGRTGTTGGGGGTGGGGTGGGGTTTIVDEEVPLAGDTQLNRDDHFAYVSGYTDGTVRPTNNITREEVAAIFYRLLTEESRAIYDTEVNDFSDVASERWSNRAISTLANAGIISGYPDGTFRPGQTITRAEFAAIAAQFDVVTEGVENPFSDTTGHWAENLISFAASKGWVSGYTDGTFLPQKAITRAEAMTLINNVLNRRVDEEGLLDEAKQWSDNPEGTWYYYEVLEATNSHDYTRRSEGNLVENWTAITNE